MRPASPLGLIGRDFTRTQAQARPYPDEQDTQGEKRRLALERRFPGKDVTQAAQAAQDEKRADK